MTRISALLSVLLVSSLVLAIPAPQGTGSPAVDSGAASPAPSPPTGAVGAQGTDVAAIGTGPTDAQGTNVAATGTGPAGAQDTNAAATGTGPAGAQVTNPAAFSSGAGTNSPDLNTGVSGSDTYTCYSGGWQSYPDQSKWVSFSSMWNANKAAMTSGCSGLGVTPENTAGQVGQVYNSILQVSAASLVDPRFILAIILQESSACVNVGATNNGVQNPGIMQTHDGSSFVGSSASSDAQQTSITQMVVDGAQGTSSGAGLVQLINQYGNIYEAARAYNSGSIDQSNLNDPMGATGSYVSDVANRMTGWVSASKGSC